jgi:hypothetical protein
VSPAGDIDGDGIGDILAGSPIETVEGREACGEVLALSGKDGAVIWRQAGRTSGERLGQCAVYVAHGGSDGTPAVAVGAPGLKGAGGVRLFAAKDGRLLGTLLSGSGD